MYVCMKYISLDCVIFRCNGFPFNGIYLLNFIIWLKSTTKLTPICHLRYLFDTFFVENKLFFSHTR